MAIPHFPNDDLWTLEYQLLSAFIDDSHKTQHNAVLYDLRHLIQNQDILYSEPRSMEMNTAPQRAVLPEVNECDRLPL